jgi:plasmid maintenance system antidote protein VapI
MLHAHAHFYNARDFLRRVTAWLDSGMTDTPSDMQTTNQEPVNTLATTHEQLEKLIPVRKSFSEGVVNVLTKLFKPSRDKYKHIREENQRKEAEKKAEIERKKVERNEIYKEAYAIANAPRIERENNQKKALKALIKSWVVENERRESIG